LPNRGQCDEDQSRLLDCQVAGWGAYSAIGAFSAARQVGWQFSLVAGYLLFFLYSIALTDLFRREARRRQWLMAPSPRMYARVFGAAAVVGRTDLPGYFH